MRPRAGRVAPVRQQPGHEPYACCVDILSGGLLSLIGLACLAVAVWALVDCAIRATAAFPAAGKLTKPAWLGLTGGAVLLQFLFGALSIFGIAAIVASIVYLVDVRPAVKEIQGGGRWN
jgi:Protein of unknown function (DUF2516)